MLFCKRTERHYTGIMQMPHKLLHLYNTISKYRPQLRWYSRQIIFDSLCCTSCLTVFSCLPSFDFFMWWTNVKIILFSWDYCTLWPESIILSRDLLHGNKIRVMSRFKFYYCWIFKYKYKVVNNAIDKSNGILKYY